MSDIGAPKVKTLQFRPAFDHDAWIILEINLRTLVMSWVLCSDS